MRENWQKIENVWTDIEGYNCFVCSPFHAWGFRLEFFYDPDEDVTVSPVPPVKEEMAGFPGIIHGGFQAMLLDEIMAWAALHHAKKTVFTGRMEVKFLLPLATGVPFLLKGKILKSSSRLIKAKAWIEAGGKVRAGGEGVCVIPDVKTYRKNLGVSEVSEDFLPYLRT